MYFTFTFYNLVFIFRDMKPENVLIGRAERMKENVLHVVDFGLNLFLYTFGLLLNLKIFSADSDYF